VPEITMPRLSDSMEEGTILRWLVADGTEVAVGEEIAEIETDKATMPYEADVAGVLHISAPEGSTLPVGAAIAWVGDDAPVAATVGAAAEEVAAPTNGAPPRTPAAAPVAPRGERIKASPVARRIAAELNIDLATLVGSGPEGRIVKRDVEAAKPAPAPVVAPVSDGETPTTTDAASVPLTRLQQTVARRMAESRSTVPSFEISMDVDMEDAVALRAQLKELGDAPSYNDMVVKACALALREYPRANGSYKDGRFELHERVNVGIAVAGDDALVVPTVFDADRKSLGEIARATRALAAAVRDGSVRPPDLSGGTFTVSNLGMYGVKAFTSIVNVPQAAILSVGAMEPRAVVRDGVIVARQTLTLTLAIDHRILYGADAAQFLGRVRQLLEQPLRLAF
jgi:pyruvate dehydrogenase E2 component (dihydrolipoamide acetyltransferase)